MTKEDLERLKALKEKAEFQKWLTSEEGLEALLLLMGKALSDSQ